MGDKKTYECVLARHGIGLNALGQLVPCCQYNPYAAGTAELRWNESQKFNIEVRDKLVKDLTAGVRNPGCIKCFKEEDMGYSSLRLDSNTWYSDILNSEEFENSNAILDIELNLGNFCNLRCIMCGPYASSSWEVAYKQNPDILNQRKLKIVEHRKQWREDEGFIEWLTPMLATCQRLNIAGGEPLLMPQTEEIVDVLLKLQRQDTIKLSFNSNYTRISTSLLNKLKLFKNAVIACSLEGIGVMNDYLRYPSRWEDIEHNIHLVRTSMGEYKYPVMVNHTIQHASTYSFPALAEFCRDHDIYLHITSVQGNPALTFHSVPPEDLKKFIKWAEKADWLDPSIRNYILNLSRTEFDLDLYKKFREYIRSFDILNKTDYDSVFNPSQV